MKNKHSTSNYRFADLHCHPNLKTFGHSYSCEPKNTNYRSHVWHKKDPTATTKILNTLLGLTKFSQVDFTTMSKANVKIAFVSLYPFEKGFFINGPLNGPLSAQIANLVTSIGYSRVRHIQKHMNYFEDLTNEYHFLLNSCKKLQVNGHPKKWMFTNSWLQVEKAIQDEDQIAVITTIEGAHVLNTGLGKYGKPTDDKEVFQNIHLLKKWEYPPLFITLAHNFNNDLCGHARSLDPLGSLVNQFDNLNKGFSELGYKVVQSLLKNDEKRILIDVKHMSVTSRREYYNLISLEFNNQIPVIVSHGAATGVDFSGNINTSLPNGYLCNDDINFYDEELVVIAKTGGLFALQLDGNRLAPKKLLKKSIFNVNDPLAHHHSAIIIWRQLQHIAEVLDQHGLFAWGSTAIGSDFDGTINPLKGIWTAEDLSLLADQLLLLAENYLKGNNKLTLLENKTITAEEIIQNFTIGNTLTFLKNNF